MNRIIRIAAYLAAAGQFVFVALLFPQTRGGDVFALLLLLILPVLCIAALYCGPDREEMRMARQVRKARLRKELQDLGTP